MASFIISIIEDNPSDLEQIVEFCRKKGEDLKTHGVEVQVHTYNSLDAFKDGVESFYPDLVITDLRLGTNSEDRTGWGTINEISHRDVVPVMVYSGFADEDAPTEEYNHPLIIRVEKGSKDPAKFLSTLTRLIGLKLKFNLEKARILNEFNKISLTTIKMLLGDGAGRELHESTLIAMATCRLSSLLSKFPSDGPKFPPEAVFLYPPLESEHYPSECLFFGDFLEYEAEGSKSLWMVCSPSCDLIITGERAPKVGNVLLLHCCRKPDDVKFLENSNPENYNGKLGDSLKRTNSKLFKCPPNVFGSNYILLDFKDYNCVSYSEIRANLEKNREKTGSTEVHWKKIASLATPYAEEVQNILVNNMSRVGVPDLESNGDEWRKGFIASN